MGRCRAKVIAGAYLFAFKSAWDLHEWLGDRGEEIRNWLWDEGTDGTGDWRVLGEKCDRGVGGCDRLRRLDAREGRRAARVAH